MRSIFTLVPRSRAAVVGAECDCGSPKAMGAEGCGRCLGLDGQGKAEGALIEALRSVSGPATVEALAFEARLSTRQVLRTVKRLMQRGRLRKLVDGEVAEHGACTGHRTSATYVLVDPDTAARAA